MMTIGTRIKTLRVLSSVTQEQLAARIGVSRRQVAYWEAGQDSPSAERIPQICRALNVSADWLLTGRAHPGMDFDHGAVMRRQNKSAHRPTSDVMKLLNQLPGAEDWEKHTTQVETVPAMREDAGSFAVRLPDNSFAPEYRSGDLVYFRPLKIVWPVPLREIATLDGHDVALSLNGKSSIRRLNVETHKKRAPSVHLVSVGKRQTRSLVRLDDSLALHGVAYKCVRPLSGIA